MNSKGIFKKILLSGMVLSASSAVWAQEQEGISIGQMNLLLTAGLTWGHDDNVAFSRSGTEVSSDFYVLSPGIRLEAPTDNSLFSLTWEGESGRYDDSPIDDYDDWSLKGAWDYDPTSRTNVGLFAEIREGHDRRGEGRIQGDFALQGIAPDDFDLNSFGGYFNYGAVGSRGRLDVEAAFTDRDYTNNRDETRFLDRDEDMIEATFYVRIRPKTSFLVGVGRSDIEYDQLFGSGAGASFDSEEQRVFVGLTWDVSAKTTGRIDFGQLEKDFDDPGRIDFDDEFYRLSVDWSPRTYSTLSFTATKETAEGYFLGDFVLREDISVSWNHYWNDRFNTIVEYGTGDDEYEPDERSDDIEFWGIEGRWQLNQHFQIGLGFHDYERNSDIGEFEYDRDVWILTLEGSL